MPKWRIFYLLWGLGHTKLLPEVSEKLNCYERVGDMAKFKEMRNSPRSIKMVQYFERIVIILLNQSFSNPLLFSHPKKSKSGALPRTCRKLSAVCIYSGKDTKYRKYL